MQSWHSGQEQRVLHAFTEGVTTWPDNASAYYKLAMLFCIQAMAHHLHAWQMCCGIRHYACHCMHCRQKVAAPDATSKEADAADVGNACR